MKKLYFILFLLAGLIFLGCNEVDPSEIDNEQPNVEDTFQETKLSINGKVEKGPFVRGSIIELRTLDSDMSATGRSYVATIENNTGEFDFGTVTIESQYAKLSANGYFFNEVEGS